MDKIEKIGIKATDIPDDDYFIDRLMDLAEKLNELIDAYNIKEEEKQFKKDEKIIRAAFEDTERKIKEEEKIK